jgi:quinol monooxygenase YgiN
MITFSIRIVTEDEKRSALLRILGALLGPTRATPGCLDARLYADLDDRRALALVEEWETRQQFDQQLDAERLKMLVAAIELASAAPVIRIDTVVREEGAAAALGGLHSPAGNNPVRQPSPTTNLGCP